MRGSQPPIQRRCRSRSIRLSARTPRSLRAYLLLLGLALLLITFMSIMGRLAPPSDTYDALVVGELPV